MSINKNSDLVESLQNCITACEYCADACLGEKDPSSLATCIRLDRNCADVCATALRLLIRNSGHTDSIIELCEEICSDCAEECEKHDHDHCEDCARACRRCEEQCRNYLN
jgi:hypothetical protein